MINKSTKTNIVWIVLVAFVLLATTGLTVTASMNTDMQHNCPFSDVGIAECVMMTSNIEQAAVHHISEFKSFLLTTLTSGIISVIAFLIFAAGLLLLFDTLLHDTKLISDRLVLSIRQRLRPPSFYKIQRWLVLHNKNSIPDISRALGYSI